MTVRNTLVSNYRTELQKHSTKKRKCYCLRGGVKLANCFGPWDYLSLDVPLGRENRNHISSGNYLLDEVRQLTRCRTTARGPCGRRDEISLGYLSRLGRGGPGQGHLQFRHLESVGEHIRYYRENKPNSLHQDVDSSEHQETSAPNEDMCACCSRPSVKPLTTPQQRQPPPPNSLVCKCSHHLYHHPCPFPLRATGKAIIPTCASLIMRLPSLELSSDSYWLPINAVFQKRHVLPNELCNSYDQNAAGSQVELPSVNKNMPSDKTRPSDCFPPPKKMSKRTTLLSGSSTRATLRCGSNSKLAENPVPESANVQPIASSERDTARMTDTSCVAAANRYQTGGSGRLLSGKLQGSSSSCIHPFHPESLQDLSIGVQKSPYDKLVSNLAAMAQTKKAIQDLYTTTTNESLSSKRLSASARKEQKAVSTSNQTSSNEEKCSNKGLSLNKLDITQERSEHDELLGESAIFCGPTVELKLTEEVNDTSLKKPFQDSLFKASNVAITFAKPRKLFRVKSVQRKMRQHTYSDDKCTKNKSKTGAALKREESRSLYNAKHRLALNKENRGGEEGVFGTQAHPESCAVRSQERMRLRLRTATCSRHRERSNNSSSGGRKVQVYLIKTSRPLEDILPQLNSTEIYLQQSGAVVDLYGE